MQPVGCPCWIDVTTDMELGPAFYSAVLGWTFEDLGPEFGGWQIASADGKQVAAMGPGAPRDWQVLLRTDDIDATVAAAVSAGGRVRVAPGDVGEMGRAAQIEDPGGACVGLWQPGSHRGFETTGSTGAPVWFEVNTRASDAVRDFFAGLFGLTAAQQEGMRYFVLHADGQPRYGVLHMNEMWDGMDPCWMTYFAVDDLDVAVAVVPQAGGAVESGPFDTPFGRIAICRDPMGTPFTLMRPA